MLFNYFNIYFLIVLRVPPTHTTPAFSDLKVDVYGMKGGRLWDERWTFMGWKVDVYGMKVDVYGMSLRMRRDPSKYQSSTQQNSLILALKVDVYGMKGGNCLGKKSTIMLE